MPTVAERESSAIDAGRINVPLPTLGGSQFWADELFWHGWHIQRNAVTGHYRLLDSRQIRRAWGTWDQCKQRLAAVMNQPSVPAMTGSAVVVLHGLLRSARGMSGLAKYLAVEGGYSTFNVNYPSTREPIARHAAGLAKILRGLEGIDAIHLVCHSLGNLVVRHYLADCARGLHGGVADPRLRRMVMLGPPNQGAKIADWLAVDPLRLLGAAHEIRDWRRLEPCLATPAFQFGVIAGGIGKSCGYNPFLAADNDLIVTVESTRLDGAADFLQLPVLHTWMMDDRRVRTATLEFLRSGKFVASSKVDQRDATNIATQKEFAP
jgi:pimeloyl-ACP methyl ester carboxylesterase